MSLSTAQRNDLIRSTLRGCKIIITPNVAISEVRENILIAVQSFTEFTPENDPFGQHDCALFLVAQQAYFFRFDQSDEGASVLTIGHFSEF